METPCPLCRSAAIYPHVRVDQYDCYRCQACGLQFLSPPPSEDALKEIYDRDYYAPWMQGDDRGPLEEMKRRTFAGYLRPVAKIRPTGRLLDVGCALGSLLEVARSFGYEASGIDLNPHAVTEARGRGFDVHCGTIETAPLTAESIDVVTMTDVIEHVADPASTMRHVLRILKPGGVVVIATPDTGSISARLLGRHWPHYKPEHLHYFERRSMRRLLIDHGLAVLSVRAAWKALTPSYVGAVLTKYATSRWLRAAGHTASGIGKYLANPALRLATGEMLVLAQRVAQTVESPESAVCMPAGGCPQPVDGMPV